jgi:hypothetical protein
MEWVDSVRGCQEKKGLEKKALCGAVLLGATGIERVVDGRA